jgi:hypothetical protein
MIHFLTTSNHPKPKELVFLVETDSEGGYIAQSDGEDIFTQADDQKLNETSPSSKDIPKPIAIFEPKHGLVTPLP